MSSASTVTHFGQFPCSDLYHMVSAPCHLCREVMKPPCVERHRCNNTVVTQFPGKVFRVQNDTRGDKPQYPRGDKPQYPRGDKPQYPRRDKQPFVKSDKSQTMCRFGESCLSVGCATHCKLPGFVPVKGSENCNKGDRCPAVVGCHFSHNSMQCSVNSTN